MARPAQKPKSRYFRVGEKIAVSGVYRVFHSEHRVSHEVTLLAGEMFPRCSQCQSKVQYELVGEAPAAQTDGDFRIRLFEIPHPRKANKEDNKK